MPSQAWHPTLIDGWGTWHPDPTYPDGPRAIPLRPRPKGRHPLREPRSRGRGGRRPPVVRQPRFRLAQDLDDCPGIVVRESGVAFPGDLACQDLPELPIDLTFHLDGEGLEGPRIDL